MTAKIASRFSQSFLLFDMTGEAGHISTTRSARALARALPWTRIRCTMSRSLTPIPPTPELAP